MSNNSDPHFLAFEKTAYDFIEQLKNIRIEIPLLPDSEARKTDLLIFCIKNIMSCVKSDIESISLKDKS